MKDLKHKLKSFYEVISLKTFLPILLILFLVIVFFWKTIFIGLYPIPGDITVGLYYPWLDYKWGYDVGVPVKNNLPSDIVSVHLPFRIFAANELGQGRLPLWNSLILTGTPLVANFQSAIFYPLNIMLFVANVVDVWVIQIILQPLLAAIFTYIYLRNKDISKLASVFGGVAFAFTGFNLIWLEYNIHGHVIYWLPLILFSIDKYFQTQKKTFLILLSFSVAFSLLAGYPQLVIYHALISGIYILFKFGKKQWIKITIVLTLFAVLGIFLSALQVLPGAELLGLSNRPIDIVTTSVANQGFLPVQNLIGIIAPDYFGNPATGNWWGVGYYDNFSFYVGVVPLVLATFALSTKKHKQDKKFLFVIFILSILLSLKTPLSLALYKTNILGFQAAIASRALFLSSFSISYLSAYGIDYLLKEKWTKNSLRSLYVPFVILFAVFFATLVSKEYAASSLDPLAFPTQTELVNRFITHMYIGLRNLIFPLFILFIASIVLLLSKVKKIKIFCVYLLLFLTFFELYRFGHKYITFNDKNLIFPKTPVIEFLIEKQKEEGPFRVDGGDAVPMNMLAPYLIETADGYDAFFSLNYAKLISQVNSGEHSQPSGRYGDIKNYNSDLVDKLGIKYVLAVKRDKIAVPNENGKINYKFDIDKFNQVYEDKSVVVLENLNARERIFTEEDGVEIKVDTTLYSPRHQKYKVYSSQNTTVLISNQHYPGWEAYVNGNKVKISNEYDSFQSIKIGQGDNNIELVYQPDSFRYGLIISTFTSVILITFIVKLIYAKKYD